MNIKDGSSYVSTGVFDQNVNDTLGGSIPAGDTDNANNLGNGETSYGYAIKGVEFSYLRVADIIQYSDSASSANVFSNVDMLYGFDKDLCADLLAAIGLEDGKARFQLADSLNTEADGSLIFGIGLHIEYSWMQQSKIHC